ncbi:hypothetical protein ACM132_001229 [Campylobacter coli]
MQNKIVATLKAHRKRELKRFYIIISFLMIAFVSLIFDIATGPSLLAPKEVLSAHFYRLLLQKRLIQQP